MSVSQASKTEYRAVLLKIQHTQESSEQLVERDFWVPFSDILLQEGGHKDLYF